ncbi:hypothetical protein AB0P36_35710 [Streptomyces flavidovirens]|uniref:hypothetical protein n=1 Tax=Streptomyces flavidovirens TaxID=67298 RepID=UPI0034419547
MAQDKYDGARAVHAGVFWVAQRWARQWQEALRRTVAALARAATCRAAKARRAARSLERGGIRHAAVLQVTVCERSACPVSRMVQARPGVRSVEVSLCTVVTRSIRSFVLGWVSVHYLLLPCRLGSRFSGWSGAVPSGEAKGCAGVGP